MRSMRLFVSTHPTVLNVQHITYIVFLLFNIPKSKGRNGYKLWKNSYSTTNSPRAGFYCLRCGNLNRLPVKNEIMSNATSQRSFHMHIPINGLLAVLIFGSVYITSSAAFAQSNQPLDLDVEKPIDTSESGRIPEEVDRRPETTNPPDRYKKQQDNSVTPSPYTTRPTIENPDNSIGPNSKYRYP